jgi:hypothetical protein
VGVPPRDAGGDRVGGCRYRAPVTPNGLATAHQMLTEALDGTPVSRPHLDGENLGEAGAWLRERAVRVLQGTVRPRVLLDQVAGQMDAQRTAADGGAADVEPWASAAALEVVTGELLGARASGDPAMVAHLTRDPDGFLVALADLAAHLIAAHDGAGAPALVRALRPPAA